MAGSELEKLSKPELIAIILRFEREALREIAGRDAGRQQRLTRGVGTTPRFTSRPWDTGTFRISFS